MGELDLIRQIKAGAKTRNAAVRVGIGDDCAVLKLPSAQELVLTTDLCLEGRHFRRDWHTAESAGHRCLARGLSDIAAMGARPVAAFLSVALPKAFDEGWFAGFMEGFERLGEEYGVELAGGDTAESAGAEMVADVVVLGAANKLRAMRRTGARAGDGIYVSGTLGGAAAELAARSAGTTWTGMGRRQSFPEPRVGLGLLLAKRGWASACIDVSDGLSTDLRHLCEASRVRGVVEIERVPVGDGATVEQALHGGEDYELLFTVMPGVKMPKMLGGISLTRIGTVSKGEGVGLAGGGELSARGWQHFDSEVACN